MERNETRKINHLDYTVAIASGLFTALLDAFFIGDISFENASDWGTAKIESFVLKTAQDHGYNGNSMASAVRFLEQKFSYSSDSVTNDFGGGLQHHLRDFTHHFSPLGCLFSIVSQFTGQVYGTDTSGALIKTPLPDWHKMNPRHAVYNGVVTWFFHLISDMAGSSGSIQKGRYGTGIPGPMLSFLKSMASLPGIRSIAGKDKKGNEKFSVTCSKLFNGTMFGEHDENGKLIAKGVQLDLRVELGIAHEVISSRQYVPVLLNDLIVSAFYTVSRLCTEIDREESHDIRRIDPRLYLPFNSPELRHMRMIASATFTTIDFLHAGLKSYLHNRNDRYGFARDFLSRINYVGLGYITLSASNELIHVAQKLHAYIDHAMDEDMKVYLEAGKDLLLLAKFTSAAGWFMTGKYVYTQVASALSEYHMAIEDRKRIEQNCADMLATLQTYQQEMESAANEYMLENLAVFDEGTEEMSKALEDRDADRFMTGSSKIQKQLGKEERFTSKDNFDDFMSSDTTLKF